jgi:hypothetical protein
MKRSTWRGLKRASRMLPPAARNAAGRGLNYAALLNRDYVTARTEILEDRDRAGELNAVTIASKRDNAGARRQATDHG